MIMRLKYKDDEGLVVELSQDEDDKFIHMDVSRVSPATVVDETGDYDMDNTDRIASCMFRTIDHAQVIARLLVGIEIQPDGAAWKRGPRGSARPTDTQGKQISKCVHLAATWTNNVLICDTCGKEVL